MSDKKTCGHIKSKHGPEQYVLCGKPANHVGHGMGQNSTTAFLCGVHARFWKARSYHVSELAGHQPAKSKPNDSHADPIDVLEVIRLRLGKAIVDLLDGTPDHDINPASTGLPASRCADIIRIRAWLVDGAKWKTLADIP